MKNYHECIIIFTKKFLQYPDSYPSTNLKIYIPYSYPLDQSKTL
jgi:hypothetical protein